MCLRSFQSTDRHQGSERCCLLKVMYLKSHFPFQKVCCYMTGIKADVSVSTTRTFLPPYHVGKRGYTRPAHVSDTSTSHQDYMHIGLHANRQMQAYTNRQLLDGPCPIICHKAISAVVWMYSQWSHMHKKISWQKHNFFFYIKMTKTPPNRHKKGYQLMSSSEHVAMDNCCCMIQVWTVRACSAENSGQICVIVGPVWFCAHCNIYEESRGCRTPRCIFQNICLTPGAMSSNWSRLNYTLLYLKPVNSLYLQKEKIMIVFKNLSLIITLF